MFGKPQKPPPRSNILPLIWIYLVKTDGTKKARCICNGSPRQKGTVTLDHTYAAALDQAGSHTFWDMAALHDYKFHGADATNAFAEAPPPNAPLVVTIDNQYKYWWTNVMKQMPIPDGHVLPVNHALQVHPESPHLWGRLIHSIFLKKGFKSSTHKPCLYHGIIDTKPIFLLR